MSVDTLVLKAVEIIIVIYGFFCCRDAVARQHWEGDSSNQSELGRGQRCLGNAAEACCSPQGVND